MKRRIMFNSGLIRKVNLRSQSFSLKIRLNSILSSLDIHKRLNWTFSYRVGKNFSQQNFVLKVTRTFRKTKETLALTYFMMRTHCISRQKRACKIVKNMQSGQSIMKWDRVLWRLIVERTYEQVKWERSAILMRIALRRCKIYRWGWTSNRLSWVRRRR